MKIHVQHIGGLDLGNHVRSHVKVIVSALYLFLFKPNEILYYMHFYYLDKPEPIKRRSIMCIDQNEMALPDSRCTDETKPFDTEPCGTQIPVCRYDDDNNSETNSIL